MKTIEDLKDILEMDEEVYLKIIERSENHSSRHMCYGRLDIIKKVLDFLEENKL